MAKRQSSSPSFETLLQSCRDVAAEQQGVLPGGSFRPTPRAQSANPHTRATVPSHPAWLKSSDALDVVPLRSSEHPKIPARPASARPAPRIAPGGSGAWESAPSVLSVPVPSVPVLSMEWLKAAEQQMSSLPRGQLTQRRYLSARGPRPADLHSDLPPVPRPASARVLPPSRDHAPHPPAGRPGTAPHAPSGHRAPEQAQVPAASHRSESAPSAAPEHGGRRPQAHRERTRETAGGGGGEEWGGERLLREEVGEVGDVDDGDGEEEGFEEGGWMDELFAIGTVLSEEEMMQRARSALRSALRCHGAAIFLVRGEGPGAAVVCNSPLSPAVQLASRQGLVAMLARGECGGEVQEMTAGAGLDPVLDHDPEAPWGEEEQTRLLAVACLDPSSRVRAVLLASRPGSRTCGAGSGAGVDAEGGRTGRPEHGGAFPPEAHGRARLLARQAGMLLALAEQGRVGEVRERESEPAARLQRQAVVGAQVQEHALAAALAQSPTRDTAIAAACLYVKRVCAASHASFYPAYSSSGHRNAKVPPLVGRALDSRQPVVVDDSLQEAQYRSRTGNRGVHGGAGASESASHALGFTPRGLHTAAEATSAAARSIVCLPLVLEGEGGKLVGVIEAVHEEVGAFSNHQAGRMTQGLSLAALVVERLQTQEKTRQLEEQLPRLMEAPTVRDLILQAEALAARTLSAACATLFVLDRPAAQLWIEARAAERRDVFDVRHGLAGLCARTGEPIRVADARKDRRFHSPTDAVKWGDLPETGVPLLLLPVLGASPDDSVRPFAGILSPGRQRAPGAEVRYVPPAASSVVAVLSLARDKPEAFSDADLRIAAQIGAGVAGALHAAMRTQLAHLLLADMRAVLAAAAKVHHALDVHGCARAIIETLPTLIKGVEAKVVIRGARGGLRELSLFRDEMRDVEVSEGDKSAGWVVAGKVMRDGEMINVATQQHLDALGYRRLDMMMRSKVGAHLGPSRGSAPRDSALRSSTPPPEAGGLAAPEDGPVLACPLFTAVDEGQVFGVVEVRRGFGRPVFNAADEVKVRYLCHHASAALKVAATREAEADHQTELASLAQASRDACLNVRDLAAARGPAQLAHTLTQACKHLLNCGHAALWMVEDKEGAGGEQVQMLVQRRVEGAEEFSRDIFATRGIPGEVVRAKQLLLLNAPQDHSFFDPEVDKAGDHACLCAVAAPVLGAVAADGSRQVLGVLVASNRFDPRRANDAPMDLLGESLSSQGDAPPPRRTQRRAPGFVSQDGWLLEALCACVAPFCNRPRVPALPVPAVAALLAQGVDGAGEAMALACKKEIEAPCFAHFQVQERGEAVTCLYPPFARGTCFQVPEGMLHAAISNRAVVHIQDSGVDPRVHATVDALDFLRDEWSLTPANSAQSPMLEKQRTNLAALRQRYGPGDAPLELKVGWENAVVVPVLDPEAQATTGLLVMVNRKGGGFDADEISLLQTLAALASAQDGRTFAEGALARALQARRHLLTGTSALLFANSSSHLSVGAAAKEAASRLRSIAAVSYAAVYINEVEFRGSSKGVCDTLNKYDSGGRTSIEKAAIGVPGRVMVTGAPVLIDDANQLDASVLPPAPTTSKSSTPPAPLTILAVPLFASAKGSHVAGVILVSGRIDNLPFSDHDQRSLSDFASIFSPHLQTIALAAGES